MRVKGFSTGYRFNSRDTGRDHANGMKAIATRIIRRKLDRAWKRENRLEEFFASLDAEREAEAAREAAWQEEMRIAMEEADRMDRAFFAWCDRVGFVPED